MKELTQEELLERNKEKLKTFNTQGWEYVEEDIKDYIDSIRAALCTDLDVSQTIKARGVLSEYVGLLNWKSITEAALAESQEEDSSEVSY
jgi:hypothetical protein